MMPKWVNQLASTLPPPKKIDVPGYGFRWEHEEKTPEVAQVAKAVRLMTALTSAYTLAALQMTTEASSLLRLVGDFAREIYLIGEGLYEGRLTEAQQRFVDQQFENHPTTLEELDAQEYGHYEGGKAIADAQRRLLDKFGLQGETLAKLGTLLAKGYSRYIHGKYDTTMELYAGPEAGFLPTGNPMQVRSVKYAVAQKTVEALNALHFMAATRPMRKLQRELAASCDRLNAVLGK